MATGTTLHGYSIADTDLMSGESTAYVLKIKDLPSEEKPREKLLQYGPTPLTVAELIAILLGVGTRKEEVMSMAQRILKEYGERAIMNETSPKALAEALDIPIGKASQIVASFELGRRYFAKRGGKPVTIRTAQHAFDYLRDMADLQKEQLRGLYLNSRYQVIHDEVISVGSLTANIVHPREVFRPALEYGAVALIIAHNHPSGSTEPTEADIQVTQQLRGAGKIMGIELLDHLVIADETYASVKEI